MCQRAIQFCAGSTKPLLFAGSFLLLLLAIAIGHTGYTTNALYQDIDPTLAQDRSITYYLQLAAATYLALITVLASLAAYYDQKHCIRALSVVTSINFVLAVAALLMVPTGPAVGKLFEERLQKSQQLYNFSDRYPIPPAVNQTTNPMLANLRQTRMVAADSKESGAPGGASESTVKANLKTDQPMNSTEATQIWDKLQARGCCGLLNATTEWNGNNNQGYPKSCCSNADDIGGQMKCRTFDADHSRPCIEVIGSTSLNLLIVLALIALVNLYLATVTGISAYRTFHYNEASQNAYT